MPRWPGAHPARWAFRAGRPGRLRKGPPAVASADTEHARPVGRGVAPALVAGGIAVAAAQLAVAAAVHAVDQLVAAGLQPVGAADLGRLQAAALGLVLAELAELVVGVQFVAQL